VSGLFAVLMGLMAAAVLGHVLVNATHERRRDLAVLRAFGFSRRQVVDTVGLQAAIYVVVALAVGVPVGLAVGRFVWRLYASFLGVVPDPVTPWSAFAAVATAALLVALLVASTPAWRAARRPPADALRAE
jgi:ABC-type antimicrobial peptide transport system permease subunit